MTGSAVLGPMMISQDRRYHAQQISPIIANPARKFSYNVHNHQQPLVIMAATRMIKEYTIKRALSIIGSTVLYPITILQQNCFHKIIAMAHRGSLL